MKCKKEGGRDDRLYWLSLLCAYFLPKLFKLDFGLAPIFSIPQEHHHSGIRTQHRGNPTHRSDCNLSPFHRSADFPCPTSIKASA